MSQLLSREDKAKSILEKRLTRKSSKQLAEKLTAASVCSLSNECLKRIVLFEDHEVDAVADARLCLFENDAGSLVEAAKELAKAFTDGWNERNPDSFFLALQAIDRRDLFCDDPAKPVNLLFAATVLLDAMKNPGTDGPVHVLQKEAICERVRRFLLANAQNVDSCNNGSELIKTVDALIDAAKRRRTEFPQAHLLYQLNVIKLTLQVSLKNLRKLTQKTRNFFRDVVIAVAAFGVAVGATMVTLGTAAVGAASAAAGVLLAKQFVTASGKFVEAPEDVLQEDEGRLGVLHNLVKLDSLRLSLAAGCDEAWGDVQKLVSLYSTPSEMTWVCLYAALEATAVRRDTSEALDVLKGFSVANYTSSLSCREKLRWYIHSGTLRQLLFIFQDREARSCSEEVKCGLKELLDEYAKLPANEVSILFKQSTDENHRPFDVAGNLLWFRTQVQKQRVPPVAALDQIQAQIELLLSHHQSPSVVSPAVQSSDGYQRTCRKIADNVRGQEVNFDRKLLSVTNEGSVCKEKIENIGSFLNDFLNTEDKLVLAVQGPAGCGKTNLARAFYNFMWSNWRTGRHAALLTVLPQTSHDSHELYVLESVVAKHGFDINDLECNPFVFIVDALDLCESKRVVDFFLQRFKHGTRNLKLIVLYRPEHIDVLPMEDTRRTFFGEHAQFVCIDASHETQEARKELAGRIPGLSRDIIDSLGDTMLSCTMLRRIVEQNVSDVERIYYNWCTGWLRYEVRRGSCDDDEEADLFPPVSLLSLVKHLSMLGSLFPETLPFSQRYVRHGGFLLRRNHDRTYQCQCAGDVFDSVIEKLDNEHADALLSRL